MEGPRKVGQRYDAAVQHAASELEDRHVAHPSNDRQLLAAEGRSTTPGPAPTFPIAASKPQTRGPFGRVLCLTLIVVLLAGSFLVDGVVYHFIHEHYSYYTRPVPNHLKVATRVLRSMEDWGENIYVLAVAFAMWRLDRFRRSRVACLFLAAVFVSLSVEGVKRLTGRERPEVSKGATVWHGPGAWRQGGDFQSFPSGHTSSAAAYSGTLAAFYPQIRPVAIALAVGCGANRMWKERHFLSDCLFGGLFGYWVGVTLPRRRFLQRFLCWFDASFAPRCSSTAASNHSRLLVA